MGVNRVILIGNVGADPEVRYLEGGDCTAVVRLATTEAYRLRSGERREQTEWHRLVFWRGLEQVVEKYVHKGDKLYVEGRITYRQWEDKAQIKHYITEILVSGMEMLGGGSGQSKPNATGYTSSEDGGMDALHESESPEYKVVNPDPDRPDLPF